MYRRFVKHNCVLSFIHCHGMRLRCVSFLFLLFFLLLIARLMRLRKFHGKGITFCKLQTFLQGYVVNLCTVVVCCRARILLSILSFFPPFFVLLVCINIYLNNCYLITCNKQQEKISCFQRKDSTPLLNI